MMAVDVVTFGCRLNIVESESMRQQALEAGHQNLVIFNTCAVTAEATRQARQAIRRLKRERPEATIVVTGCAAQIEPAMFAGMDEVDRVIGNSEKSQSQTWIKLSDPAASNERVHVADIMTVRETASHLIDGFEGRTRAFVQVQNGCDHRCTFCIIPYGRGPSRSVAMGAAVDQIKRLVDRGYKEVVLTGVDMTSWGADLPGAPRLGQLLQSILTHVPDLPRLRLSSIDSIEADEALIEALACERRLMPHLHLSLQAGDDMILKRMKPSPSARKLRLYVPISCSEQILSPGFQPKPKPCSTIHLLWWANATSLICTYSHSPPAMAHRRRGCRNCRSRWSRNGPSACAQRVITPSMPIFKANLARSKMCWSSRTIWDVAKDLPPSGSARKSPPDKSFRPRSSASRAMT